jgi:hypothetical protein
MEVNDLSFGSITIDGVTYENDVVIKNSAVKKRKKAESKKYREQYGHTPLSTKEYPLEMQIPNHRGRP